jgi:hypothetical protein
MTTTIRRSATNIHRTRDGLKILRTAAAAEYLSTHTGTAYRRQAPSMNQPLSQSIAEANTSPNQRINSNADLQRGASKLQDKIQRHRSATSTTRQPTCTASTARHTADPYLRRQKQKNSKKTNLGNAETGNAPERRRGSRVPAGATVSRKEQRAGETARRNRTGNPHCVRQKNKRARGQCGTANRLRYHASRRHAARPAPPTPAHYTAREQTAQHNDNKIIEEGIFCLRSPSYLAQAHRCLSWLQSHRGTAS